MDFLIHIRFISADEEVPFIYLLSFLFIFYLSLYIFLLLPDNAYFLLLIKRARQEFALAGVGKIVNQQRNHESALLHAGEAMM